VVNQWLLRCAVDLRSGRLTNSLQSAALSLGAAPLLARLLRKIISQIRFSIFQGNPFDCAAWQSFCAVGAQRTRAMIETVSAFLGLVSAGIFLAHALEGFHSRA
jgi:hypothetical protein